MKRKSKIFLFLLIFTFSLSSITVLFLPQVQALTPEESVSSAILERINIELSAGEGMFDSFWDYEKDVYRVSRVYNVPNPTEITEDSVTFETHITVEANIRHFTDYGKDNVYWNAECKTVKYLWLSIASADDWFWTSPSKLHYDQYYVEYQDYDFKPRSIYEPSNYLKAKGYEGKFDLNVNFDRFENAYGIVNDENQSEIAISTLEIVPVKASITKGDSFVTGNYSDIFNGLGETKATVLDYTTNRPAVNTYNAMDSQVQSRVSDLIRDEIIGVYAIEEKPASFTDSYDGTLGYQGSEWVYRGDLTRKEPYVFELPAKNRPRVLVYEQQIKRGNCYMAIDTEGLGAGFKDGTPLLNYFGVADTPFRQVGWHIQELVHIQTVEIQFVAKAKLEAEPFVLERLLEEPNIWNGDVIWNIAMTGNTEASIIIDSGFLQKLWEKIVNSGMLTWVIVGIVLVGVGFLGYKAYTSPMVQRRIGAKMALQTEDLKKKKPNNVKRNQGKLQKLFGKPKNNKK